MASGEKNSEPMVDAREIEFALRGPLSGKASVSAAQVVGAIHGLREERNIPFKTVSVGVVGALLNEMVQAKDPIVAMKGNGSARFYYLVDGQQAGTSRQSSESVGPSDKDVAEKTPSWRPRLRFIRLNQPWRKVISKLLWCLLILVALYFLVWAFYGIFEWGKAVLKTSFVVKAEPKSVPTPTGKAEKKIEPVPKNSLKIEIDEPAKAYIKRMRSL